MKLTIRRHKNGISSELINSELVFSTKVNDIIISLTVYIDYEKGTYDIVQDTQEGIFPRLNNSECETNRAYFNLALEALDLIEKELYK